MRKLAIGVIAGLVLALGSGTAGPAGSGAIEKVFNDCFTDRDLRTAPTPFDGRSDYGAFIEHGIPAGGLFSGAEEIKTAEQAKIFGGTAGAAYATERFAHSTLPVDGVERVRHTTASTSPIRRGSHLIR